MAAKSDTTDRRRKPRYKVKLRARVLVHSVASGTSFTFWTENVSESGLLISSDDQEYPIEEESELDTWLFLDDSDSNKVHFGAVVVRSVGKRGFGLQIHDISNEMSERLCKFLREFIDANPDLSC